MSAADTSILDRMELAVENVRRRLERAAAALEVVEKKCRMSDERTFCVSCGDCVAICPEDAITLTDFLGFKKFFRYLDRGEPEWPRRF